MEVVVGGAVSGGVVGGDVAEMGNSEVVSREYSF